MRIPNGTRVMFTWRGQGRTGVVVDSIMFNRQIRHGVRDDRDGHIYDVWADMAIRELRFRIDDKVTWTGVLSKTARLGRVVDVGTDGMVTIRSNKGGWTRVHESRLERVIDR